MTYILSLCGLFLSSALIPFDLCFRLLRDFRREFRRMREWRLIERRYRAMKRDKQTTTASERA